MVLNSLSEFPYIFKLFGYQHMMALSQLPRRHHHQQLYRTTPTRRKRHRYYYETGIQVLKRYQALTNQRSPTMSTSLMASRSPSNTITPTDFAKEPPPSTGRSNLTQATEHGLNGAQCSKHVTLTATPNSATPSAAG